MIFQSKKIRYQHLLNWLFFNNNDTKNDKPNRIKYYPDIEIHRSSVNKSEYHTFFHENKIGDVLGQKVLKYVKKEKPQIAIAS